MRVAAYKCFPPKAAFCCCCSVAQSCPTLWDPWTAAYQASLSIANSWNLPKLTSIKSVMPSNHLILWHPICLLPSILYMCYIKFYMLYIIITNDTQICNMANMITKTQREKYHGIKDSCTRLLRIHPQTNKCINLPVLDPKVGGMPCIQQAPQRCWIFLLSLHSHHFTMIPNPVFIVIALSSPTGFGPLWIQSLCLSRSVESFCHPLWPVQYSKRFVESNIKGRGNWKGISFHSSSTFEKYYWWC